VTTVIIYYFLVQTRRFADDVLCMLQYATITAS